MVAWPVGIRSFGSRATKRFAEGRRRSFPAAALPRIDAVLGLLERGSSPEDLRRAGYRVHRLAGDRKGCSAVSVSAALRVVFRFEGGNAYDVEVVDYHRS